jgi:hypothetical protein
MIKKSKKNRSSEKNEMLEDKHQNHLDDDHFDILHQKIVNYLTSGKVHSTLVGIMINLDGDKGKKDVVEATIFADYIIKFLKKVNE